MEKIQVELLAKDKEKYTEEVKHWRERASEAEQTIKKKSGAGNDFLGWLDLPEKIKGEEIDQIKKAATKIQGQSDAIVVIGIGGSYLGARAVIESLKPTFFNQLNKEERGGPEIYFAGQNLSGSYLNDLINIIGEKDYSVIVISKSGTTLEPGLAFRTFRKILLEKYGAEGAKERIFVVTDEHKGVLKEIADKEGYEKFIIPNDIGGRYSVLSACGLLPIAASGIDIDMLISGAGEQLSEFETEGSTASDYAILRNILHQSSKKEVEILVNYEPRLFSMAEWWKQLFGESEGKDGKGVFPASVNFTTDLHSLGQFIQEGSKIAFETVLKVKETDNDRLIPSSEDNFDGLDYLSGKQFDFVNKIAMEATIAAHTEGDIPNILITIPKLDAFYLGKLIYFFELSCAISAYLLGVNPFNQPGVEQYKKKMYSLLGR